MPPPPTATTRSPVWDAGEPYSYTCSVANVTAGFTNTAVVTGAPPVGSVVTGTDTATVAVVNPAMAITKSPATQHIESGDAVTFTISLTNTGDITLTTVAIVDAAAPPTATTAPSIWLPVSRTATPAPCSMSRRTSPIP